MRTELDAPLAPLTTMHVGGPATRLVTVETPDELVDAVREVDDAEEPLLVVSGGSNLVIADEGFAGTVVHIATRGIDVESADYCGGAYVRVAAGERWDDVVERAVQEGWAGIEALSGIPGCAGATPVQNVGAYGQEVAQTIAQVRVWDRIEARVRTFVAADCRFAYRHSIFKDQSWRGQGRYVVIDVAFQLEIADLSRPVAYKALADGLGVDIGARVPLAEARAAVLAQRGRRGMVYDPADHDTWSCGSFFTNPILAPAELAAFEQRAAQRLGADVAIPTFPGGGDRTKVAAAWLIEHAGFAKGYRMPGPAALSTKHTLAITNRGDARAADVVALAREIRDGVREAFGVTLVNEPVFVGDQL